MEKGDGENRLAHRRGHSVCSMNDKERNRWNLLHEFRDTIAMKSKSHASICVKDSATQKSIHDL